MSNLKTLKDFNDGNFHEAADGCDECKAKAQVKVTHVVENENIGDITVIIKHEKNCSSLCFDCVESDCENCITDQETMDIAGWDYADNKITLPFGEFHSYKSTANVRLCLNCFKFVIGVPLILFPSDKHSNMYQVDFCFNCVEKLNIFKFMSHPAKPSNQTNKTLIPLNSLFKSIELIALKMRDWIHVLVNWMESMYYYFNPGHLGYKMQSNIYTKKRQKQFRGKSIEVPCYIPNLMSFCRIMKRYCKKD